MTAGEEEMLPKVPVERSTPSMDSSDAPGTPRPVHEPPGVYYTPSLSPGGRRLA